MESLWQINTAAAFWGLFQRAQDLFEYGCICIYYPYRQNSNWPCIYLCYKLMCKTWSHLGLKSGTALCSCRFKLIIILSWETRGFGWFVAPDWCSADRVSDREPVTSTRPLVEWTGPNIAWALACLSSPLTLCLRGPGIGPQLSPHLPIFFNYTAAYCFWAIWKADIETR